MHALEDEPDHRGRWGRMGVGLGIALAIGAALVIGADQIVPSKRLLAEVLPIEMVDVQEPPPKQEEPPPPPPPPKELPKPKPKAQEPQLPAAAPPPPQANPNPETPAPESVGLDATSFGAGSGGPAFHVGTSQMGAPGGGPARVDPGEQELKPAPKLVEARAYAGNQQPVYSDAARRKGLEGLMVIEVEIDAQGRVRRALVRGKIDPDMDEAARRLVETWRFEPATLGGRPVAHTQLLRFRFKLE